MRTELLFIVNPVAGHGRSLRVFGRVSSVIDQVAHLRPIIWKTQGPGHGTELGERAAREGYTRIVAVGGDGTMHEVINGIMAAGRALVKDLEFGVVPAGSGNDFARNLGIPTNPGALATLLASGEAGLVDLGIVHGRYFANVAGVGFDAEVARLANRIPKSVPGALTYVVCALAGIATYRNASMRLEVDGRTIERRALLVAVGNGVGYGGGLKICPGARVDDGLFRVVVAGDLSRPQVLRVLPAVFGGQHTRHRLVEVFDGAEVSVEADRPLAIQADGEIVGTVPATIRIVPAAIKVIGHRAEKPTGSYDEATDGELRPRLERLPEDA